MTSDTVEQTAATEIDVPARPFKLAEHVVWCLQEAHIVNPEAWLMALEPVGFQSNDVNVQRFWINRCWLQILASLPEELALDTRNARGCLINDIALEEWSVLFRKEVIPCAIKHKLLTQVLPSPSNTIDSPTSSDGSSSTALPVSTT